MARRNDHTRDELVTMTLHNVNQFLTEHSYHELSLRKIAAMIGYAPSTLINLFGSYDLLLLHVIGGIVDQLRDDITAALSLESDPHQQLLSVAKSYLHFAKQHRFAWLLVFAHSMGGEKLPSWQQYRIDYLLGLLEQIITQLGYHQHPAAITEASRVLWAGVHGITLLAVEDKFFTAYPVDAERLIENLLNHYLASWSQQKD